jgi:hypothetical protein
MSRQWNTRNYYTEAIQAAIEGAKGAIIGRASGKFAQPANKTILSNH